MQNPQPLPIRSIAVDTDDVDHLSGVQPERRRRYEQLHRGVFRSSLNERAWGSAALLHERWSCGVRVRCDRPSGYVSFGLLSWDRGDVRWCGASLAPGCLVRVVDPWELSSSGPLDLVCFGVGSAALHATALQLAGTEWTPPPGNRRRDGVDGRIAARVLEMLRVLNSVTSEPAALAAAEAELLVLAARLELAADLAPVEPLPRPSRRRAVVRRIEEYLDANEDEVPTIPELCALARVSERTLEYSFREHLGTTPVRFLKVRRLNRVRRALLAAGPGARVTEIALRAGLYDLGRFAGEYRRLFDELPSETVRDSAYRGAGSRRTVQLARLDGEAPGDRGRSRPARVARRYGLR